MRQQNWLNGFSRLGEPFEDRNRHSAIHELSSGRGRTAIGCPAPADDLPSLSITRLWLVIGRTPGHQRPLINPVQTIEGLSAKIESLSSPVLDAQTKRPEQERKRECALPESLLSALATWPIYSAAGGCPIPAYCSPFLVRPTQLIGGALGLCGNVP